MALIDEIIKVFNNNHNKWMSRTEVYNYIDKSVFGENKRGIEGYKNMISRDLSQRYTNLFEEDDSGKPKKYRLLTTNSKEINLNKKYSVNDIKLFIDNNIYEEIAFDSESEYEEFVKKKYKIIFGEHTQYYDVKKAVGKRICDALLYDNDLDRVIVVENELSKHDLWSHIIPQLNGFFIGLKEEETRNNLKYKIDWGDNELNAIKAIDKFNFDIIVVIDRITFNIREESKRINRYMQGFNKHNKTKILFKEFRVFVSQDGHEIYHVE